MLLVWLHMIINTRELDPPACQNMLAHSAVSSALCHVGLILLLCMCLPGFASERDVARPIDAECHGSMKEMKRVGGNSNPPVQWVRPSKCLRRGQPKSTGMSLHRDRWRTHHGKSGLFALFDSQVREVPPIQSPPGMSDFFWEGRPEESGSFASLRKRRWKMG
jgi:hypothetical protein